VELARRESADANNDGTIHISDDIASLLHWHFTPAGQSRRRR
jgi:hypothetical protein